MRARIQSQAAPPVSMAWSPALLPPHQAGDLHLQVPGIHGLALSQNQRLCLLQRKAMLLIEHWLHLTMMTMKMNRYRVEKALSDQT